MTAARLLKHFKDFIRKYSNMNVIRDKLDNFEEIFAKNFFNFWTKR